MQAEPKHGLEQNSQSPLVLKNSQKTAVSFYLLLCKGRQVRAAGRGMLQSPPRVPQSQFNSNLYILIDDLRYMGHQNEQGSVSSLFIMSYWWMATFLHGQCTGHFYSTQTQNWDVTAKAICPEKLAMHSVWLHLEKVCRKLKDTIKTSFH